MTVRDVFAHERYPVLEVSLWEAFRATVEAAPDAVAVIHGDDQFSRLELFGRATACAAALDRLGIGNGSTVLFQSESDDRCAVVALAASRVGTVLAIIPSTMGSREAELICDMVSPEVVICPDQASVDRWRQRGATLRIVAVGDLVDAAATGEVPETPLAVDRAAVIGFTAGTTGTPKGVVQTSAALNYASARWAERVGLAIGDRVLASMPLSYMAGYAFNLHLTLSRGLTLVCMRKWNAQHALELVSTRHCAWSMMVPSQVVMLIDAVREVGLPAKWGSLRAITCGGSPMHESFAHQVTQTLQTKLLRAYGLSECLGAAMMPPASSDEHRDNYDGAPILNTDVEAFAEDGTMLPRGTVGIGGVRGPALMLGYLGDAARGNDFNGSGFLMTGDLIVREANGFVKVVGRVRDMIIRGGLNIDPSEIERLIATHPNVRDVVVVGYPDHRLGEKVGAVVVPTPGASLTLAEIVAYLSEAGLSRQKLPQLYREVQQLPISPLGKPLKEEVRRMLLDLDGSITDSGTAAGAPHNSSGSIEASR
jgi:acyl-CoA synthetase (AMP-forming)/AMP-acid ligase II